MKKIYSLLMILGLILALGACSKDEIGNTNAVNLAGEWLVTVDVVDQNGDVIYEDPYGLGPVLMLTHNTNQDDGKYIWVNDLGNFWEFQCKVPANMGALTFGSADVVEDILNGAGVTLTDGKVVVNGAKSPVGNMPVDAIEFKVQFDDDGYGFIYWVHGYRRTGLASGEE